jgi:hypothetical protein
MLQSAIGQNDAVPMIVRSPDLGQTWLEPEPLWPELAEKYSIFVNISRGLGDDLFLFGVRWKIDIPGESFVHPQNFGMKQNELIWSRSGDGGRSWSPPQLIPMPVPGSAEAPGTLLVTRFGRWLVPYAPYPTWDPSEAVDVSKVLVLGSDDQGQSWPHHAAMLQPAEPNSSGNEQWVLELSDGRLLGVAWHVDLAGQKAYPNMYALSHDGGLTWSPTRSTSLLGQSIGAAALPEGRVACVYNVRTTGQPGVWLAIARPTEADFGVELNEIVWRAHIPTQGGSSGQLAEGGWLDFAFGEPAVIALPDGSLLVLLWCIQPDGRGIQYVKVALT